MSVVASPTERLEVLFGQVDAALQSHLDALVAEWKQDHDEAASDERPPMPDTVDASCAWWRPAGMPRPPAARMGSAPR